MDRDRNPVIDVKLLELLTCPLTKGPLKWDADRQELISKSARLAYPVRDGIPVMLPSEARSFDPDEPVLPAAATGQDGEAGGQA